MSTHDVIVLGGGPAGASAAITAASLGLDTVLIDEQIAAGGQVWRPPSPALTNPPYGPDAKAGADLRARLAASKAVCRFGHRAWFVGHGFVVHTLGADGPEEVQANALILATGAIERHVPVAGWTLPGVMGLAAATILLKSDGVLPGRRVVVAGVGPLLPLVAGAVIAAGGKVAAVVDANPRLAWLRDARALAGRIDLVGRGLGWAAKLAHAGVPWFCAHMVRRIDGTDGVERVAVGAVDAAWAPRRDVPERIFECDAVCMGFGLIPSTEIDRLLGATHVYDAARGGWCPVVDDGQTTTIARLYACGDGAGVLGAAAAALRGELAALTAARDLGRITAAAYRERVAPGRQRLARAARFGRAMTTLCSPRAGIANGIAPDTVVCRCETVRRSEIDRAIDAGAVTLNDLKSATRCGMGPCGGRVCEDAAAHLIAAATGIPRASIMPSTARPPLRPVPLDVVAGEFDYASLPMTEPAPL